METSLYLVSNAIRVYAICILLDSFLGELKSRTIYKKAAYIAYYRKSGLDYITKYEYQSCYQYSSNHLNFYSVLCNLEKTSLFCNMGLCGWNVYRLDCIFCFGRATVCAKRSFAKHFIFNCCLFIPTFIS